ncbi:MAG: hypothetical protein LUH42_06635 [Oscillospiraceae bacterium]|nr:hypothetical protein [Oscillospiraceae bacterium]
MEVNGSLSLRIHRANGAVEAEQLHALHQYYIANARAREEFTTMWSMSDQVAWGFNWGRTRGWREVWWSNVGRMDLSVHEGFREVVERWPEAGGREPRGLGFYEMNELNSGVVEASEDGETVRASWLCHGYAPMSLSASGKRDGAFTVERYGADFIFEDGRWKYLHEMVASDMHVPFDHKNWGRGAYLSALLLAGEVTEEELENTDYQTPPPVGGMAPPPRSEPFAAHETYSLAQPAQKSCAAPEAYSHLDDKNTYAPYMDPADFVQHSDWLQW